ncbi:unnamed protein product [Anisakis simplex]|uniref:Glyco_trans_2-like domain-containing protein n=1 Tax=Anisakis simplex TaxID=6269 RepID=A0A0M3JBZ1_ANISI|nr:unnamed protein product [Anisakis simplex]
MLLAGYKPVDELQQQSKSSQGWYDVPVEMRPKRSCKKRALQRCDSRLWMPPPRIVLITIPNDVGFDQFVERIHNSLGNKSAILIDIDETTQGRYDAINEMMRSLSTNFDDCNCSSEDESAEVDSLDDTSLVFSCSLSFNLSTFL